MNQQPIAEASNQQFNEEWNNLQSIYSHKGQKKILKAKLKFQRRVHKLETRIAHAISRKDSAVEHQARKDLDDLLRSQNENRILPSRCISANRLDDAQSSFVDAKQQAGIDQVTLIFQQLLASFDNHSTQYGQANSRKHIQNSKARNLLQHMTRGTQTSDMFSDKAALRGYVRKKFHGRATLIIKSLGNLSPERLKRSPIEDINDEYRCQYQSQREIINECFEKLSHVKRVCSIGCGPGNDVVGLISCLSMQFSNEQIMSRSNVHIQRTKYKVNEVLLLDFAMNEWKEAVLNGLIPILQPDYVNNILCEQCDVSKPLLPVEANEETNNSSIADFVQSADMFLTSYLLSETRFSWDIFFVQLVQLAPVGALFYFAEPMAWQLHRLIKMSILGSSTDNINTDWMNKISQTVDLTPLQRLKFVWIDSSMHHPELQQMDGRAGGPAVLLAIKS